MLVIAAAGCQNKSQESGTQFDRYIKNLRVFDTDISYIKDEAASFYGPLRVVRDGFGHVSVVDYTDWTVHLINPEGELIDQVGGKGRGPGEFEVINDLSLGCDNELFVVDKKLSKVAEYRITKDSLIHIKDAILPSYSPLSIQSFYSCDSVGRFGVFKNFKKNIDDYNSFSLYELSDDFKLGKKIADLKQPETLESEGLLNENPIGFRGYWDFKEENFFYTHSNSLTVKIINLKSNKREQIKALDIPPNKMTKEERERFIQHLRISFSSVPGLKEEIETRENLPFYYSYVANKEFSYFADSGIGSETGIILRFNHETQKLSTFTVPGIFQLQDVRGNYLYGIQNQDGNNQVVTITLSD